MSHWSFTDCEPLLLNKSAQLILGMLLVDIVMDGITEDVVSLLVSLHDEKGILKVYKVLGGIPLAGKLTVCECRKISGLIRLVLYIKPPIFEGLTKGNKIGGICMDV